MGAQDAEKGVTANDTVPLMSVADELLVRASTHIFRRATDDNLGEVFYKLRGVGIQWGYWKDSLPPSTLKSQSVPVPRKEHTWIPANEDVQEETCLVRLSYADALEVYMEGSFELVEVQPLTATPKINVGRICLGAEYCAESPARYLGRNGARHGLVVRRHELLVRSSLAQVLKHPRTTEERDVREAARSLERLKVEARDPSREMVPLLPSDVRLGSVLDAVSDLLSEPVEEGARDLRLALLAWFMRTHQNYRVDKRTSEKAALMHWLASVKGRLPEEMHSEGTLARIALVANTNKAGGAPKI